MCPLSGRAYSPHMGDVATRPVMRNRLHPPPVLPLLLEEDLCRRLLKQVGPSLGLWRAAEVAALHEQEFESPVLDVGCGDGLVTSLVLPHVAVGVDPDADSLARAAERGVYQRLVCGPIEHAPLAPSSMQTALANSVLEHLSPLTPAVQAIVRALRPGGRLIMTVPTDAFAHWLFLKSSRYAAWRNHQLHHLHLWPVDRWTEFLKGCGLLVEQERRYLHPYHVRMWDCLELLQLVHIGRHGLFSMLWRRLPRSLFGRMATWMSLQDLAASAPSGGVLLVARKVSAR